MTKTPEQMAEEYTKDWHQDCDYPEEILRHTKKATETVFLAGYKTNKNWFLGFDANFMFGNQVRVTGLFDDLVDSYGNITDINGDIAKVLVYARGFNANFAVGKVFPILSPNKNSGIFVHAGMGYLLHRIRIETQDQVVPQIELDYKKGYDRLTIGPNVHEVVGYSFMSNGG